MRRSILGALSICLAAVLWGLDGVVLTPRLFNLSVPFVVFLLHLVPFTLMQPFLFATYGVVRRLKMEDWVTLTLVALCGGILGTFAIVKALFLVDFNQLSVVVLLQKLQPVFAIVLAGVLLGERDHQPISTLGHVGPLRRLSPDLWLAGTRDRHGSSTTIAAAWAAVAAAAFGSATVFGKRLLESLDFRQATLRAMG